MYIFLICIVVYLLLGIIICDSAFEYIKKERQDLYIQIQMQSYIIPIIYFMVSIGWFPMIFFGAISKIKINFKGK